MRPAIRSLDRLGAALDVGDPVAARREIENLRAYIEALYSRLDECIECGEPLPRGAKCRVCAVCEAARHEWSVNAPAGLLWREIRFEIAQQLDDLPLDFLDRFSEEVRDVAVGIIDDLIERSRLGLAGW